jgi:hypothetical protein
MFPLIVQLVSELIVNVAFRVQLPDGFGPYEIPPRSVSVIGYTGASFAIVICIATVMLGSPLIVRFDREQFAGVMVSVELSDPSPELFRVKAKSPETPMVPPPGQAPL